MYATHVSYVLYMTYYREKKSARNCIGWNGVGTCLSLAHVQHSEVATHGVFSWTWGLLLVACRWCRRVKLGACMKGKHSALVQPEEVGHAYGMHRTPCHIWLVILLINVATALEVHFCTCKCPRKIHYAPSLHLYSCEKMFGSMRFSQKRLDTLTENLNWTNGYQHIFKFTQFATC